MRNEKIDEFKKHIEKAVELLTEILFENRWDINKLTFLTKLFAKLLSVYEQLDAL